MVKDFVMFLNRDTRFHSGVDSTRRDSIKDILEMEGDGRTQVWGSHLEKPVTADNVFKSARGLIVDGNSTEHETTFM